ncbi:phage protease [Chromobacterium haemolyticum]|uniref:phage protease n=1 Tax=Chromobacterium haemolyticum TaxID=394935 RepID=UPI000DEF9B35|nr:phage protease [Chromobacterium haemolyticum]
MRSRIFKLSQDTPGRVIRMLSGMAELPEGKATSWVTITREGSFTDPRYDRFEITREMLLSMVRNFDAGVVGTDIFLDVDHKPGDGAAAKICKLAVEGGRLRALVEWTPFGRSAVKDRGFRYLSAEFSDNWKDNEQGRSHGPVLLGAGLTVRPVIKRLDPVTLSCDSGADIPVLLHPELERTLLSEAKTTMNKYLKALLEALAARKLSEQAVAAVKTLAETQLVDITDESEAKLLCEQLEQAAVKLSEELGKLQATGAAPVIQLSMAGPDQAAISAAVNKLLTERDTAAKTLAETVEGKRKLLADTIGAAEGLDDAAKKALTEAAVGVITADTTDDQVKALAAMQIQNANEVAAARQLSALGYVPSGSPHITVPVEGVKKLSEFYREQLAKTSYAGQLHLDAKRELPPFCLRVLAEFDRLHAARLDNEYKVLAQGQGNMDMGNTALPVGVQREVIREALSDLNVLSLVQTLTDFAGAATTQIPYELRDVSLVMNDGIVYEGQPIPYAGITQQMDTVYVTPMKLALSITNEVQFFTRASALNWDALARNIESNARVLRELVARRICNELQRAADSYLAIPVANESISAQLGGAKSTVKLANWPVVRPAQARDLQGNAVGLPENPITVTLNSVQISQWDGSGKQPAGTYWRVISFNLGVLQFINQAGQPVVPAATGTNTVSYSRATNVAKFNLDPNAGVTQEKWLNGLIQQVGSRKAMMLGQRYVTPDFLLMSPTLNDTASNADQFVASLKRNGSDTNSAGDLAAIKDIPSFGTNAPGVDLGDERIIMGQRNVLGYVVAKPFVTGEPFELTGADGRPVGKKAAYGEEYNAIAVPRPVRNRFTSVIVYSATARADL